jgi:hypothetical protein
MSNKLESERVYDIRILERNIRKGLITRKDVDKYLKSLPDREGNAVRMGDEEPAADMSESGEPNPAEGMNGVQIG